MSLRNLISTAKGEFKTSNLDITEENLANHLEDYRDIISYWRVYPDKFIDYLVSIDPNCNFKFYFAQRIALRVFMRYKTVFATCSRGFSKSFIAVMALMLKCILYPGARIATTSSGKSQSASILSSKLAEICQLIPALANEIMWDTRGKPQQTTQSRDQVSYVFKNGSILTNCAMTETSRGLRFQALLVEECAKVDQEKLTEIIMPMLVVSRKVNGKTDPHEVLNQSAVFVTSAGFKNSYSYEKLINTLCMMVAKPEEAFIFGFSWRCPVVEGLQPENFIQQQEQDTSMDEASFTREYKQELYSINMVNCWKPLKVA